MQFIETRNIEVNKIIPNPKQPRRFFDEAALDELAESIKRDGLLQDILVRPTGDGMYEVIFGERRFQAIRRLGLEEINVKVAEVSDAEMLRLALIENLQRSNLSAIEETEAIRGLMEECGLNQTDVAQQLGKRQSFVASRLALLKLPEAIQTKIAQGKISVSHGELLSRISDEELLQQLASEVEAGMSVRKLERRIQQKTSPSSSKSSETEAKAERMRSDAEAEPLEGIESASEDDGGDKELAGQISEEIEEEEKKLEETEEHVAVSSDSAEDSSVEEPQVSLEAPIEGIKKFAVCPTALLEDTEGEPQRSQRQQIYELISEKTGLSKPLLREIDELIGSNTARRKDVFDLVLYVTKESEILRKKLELEQVEMTTKLVKAIAMFHNDARNHFRDVFCPACNQLLSTCLLPRFLVGERVPCTHCDAVIELKPTIVKERKIGL